MQVKGPFGQIGAIKSILTDFLKPSTQFATPQDGQGSRLRY